MLELMMKLSKSELPVPVVNGVHLHSAYNPIKEAETLVDKYDSMLAEKKDILVLGLGFAYHVDQISMRLRKNHSNNYQIVVIEPSQELVDEYRRTKGNEHIDFTIYSEDEMQKLFHNEELINFLLKKPGIIPHPPSFNLHTSYFKRFLSFESSQRIGDLKVLVKDQDIIEYLNQYESHLTINELAEMSVRHKVTKNDLLMLMLSEYKNGAKQ
jgi:hypothetical protein